MNRNISQNKHILKTLRLVYFRLGALVPLPKKFCTRVLGSVVIQLYAGECTTSADRAFASSHDWFSCCSSL